MEKKIIILTVSLVILLALFSQLAIVRAVIDDDEFAWKLHRYQELGIEFKITREWSSMPMGDYKGVFFTISHGDPRYFTHEFFILVSDVKYNPLALPFFHSNLTDLNKYEIRKGTIFVDGRSAEMLSCIPKQDISDYAPGVHFGKKGEVILRVVELRKNNKYYYIAWYASGPKDFEWVDRDDEKIFRRILSTLKIKSTGIREIAPFSIGRQAIKEVNAVEALPDLVIKDIYYINPYLRVEICNKGGRFGAGNFLIKIESDAKMFPGNASYPFSIPMPGACESGGGFSIGLIGAKEGDIKNVTATVDWENKVKESNEENNTMTKTIEFK